jgi:hypothetical protein
MFGRLTNGGAARQRERLMQEERWNGESTALPPPAGAKLEG